MRHIMDAVNIEFVSRLSVFVSNVDKKLSDLVIQPPLEHATTIITVLLLLFIPRERILQEFHEGF